MMAGGLLDVVPDCSPSKAAGLFDSFQALYEQLKSLNSTGNDFSIKAEGSREIKLSHQTFGGRLEGYSRATKMEDGKWVTVQVRRWSNFNQFFTVELFDDKGNSMASVKSGYCGGDLTVPFKDMQDGKDVLIKSALRAATGQDFEIKQK